MTDDGNGVSLPFPPGGRRGRASRRTTTPPRDIEVELESASRNLRAARAVEVPAILAVVLTCPNCGDTATVEAKLQARMTRDTDGKGAMGLRVRSPKVSHLCEQGSLGLAEGPRER